MKDRRKFLKNAGSTALFASLGSSFFISCDESDDNVTPPNTVPEDGYTSEGSVYTIYLDHPSFSLLKSSGGWKEFQDSGMLLVNVGQHVVRAFSIVCPHADCRDSLEYSNENFTCTCHTSIFKNDGTRVSGPANQDLTSYSASLKDNILTVTK